MSNQQNNEEQSKLHVNADGNLSNNNSSEKNHQLRERRELKPTPFVIVGSDQDGWFVTLGNLRLSDGGDTYEECVRMVESRDWDLMINLMLSLAESVARFEQERIKIEERINRAMGDKPSDN